MRGHRYGTQDEFRSFSSAMQIWGLPPPLAMLDGLLLGGACGAFNGVMTARAECWRCCRSGGRFWPSAAAGGDR